MSVMRYVRGSRAWRAARDRRLCDQTRARVHEIVDGEVLDPRERAVLFVHLEACARCGAAAEEIRELKAAIARVGRKDDAAVIERLRGLAQRLCDGTEPGFVD